MQSHELEQHRQRDAVSLLMAGTFFLVMGVLVMIGSVWASERPHALVVNVVAAIVLLIVGGGMAATGWYYKSRSASRQSDSQAPRGDT